jgi:hypothetical protein
MVKAILMEVLPQWNFGAYPEPVRPGSRMVWASQPQGWKPLVTGPGRSYLGDEVGPGPKFPPGLGHSPRPLLPRPAGKEGDAVVLHAGGPANAKLSESDSTAS